MTVYLETKFYHKDFMLLIYETMQTHFHKNAKQSSNAMPSFFSKNVA